MAPRYTSPLSTASLPGSTASSSRAGGRTKSTVRFHGIASPVLQLAILHPDVILGKAGVGLKPSAMKPLSSRLLKNYIVVACASQDSSVRLLRIPLDHTDSSDIQEFIFSGVSAHRSAVETLSLSIVSSTSPTNSSTNSESIMIASTSRSSSGLLLLYKLAIEAHDGGVVLVQSDNIFPMPLISPALTIAFHATYPTKLLLADEKGSVRLGDMNSREWALIAQARRALDVCWCDGGNQIAVLWKGGELGVYNVEDGKYKSYGVVHLKAEEAKNTSNDTPDDVNLPPLNEKKITSASKGFLTPVSIGTSEALLISIDAFVWVFPLPRNATATPPPPRRLPVPALSSPTLSLSAQISLSSRQLTLALPTAQRLILLAFPIPPSLLPPPSSPFVLPVGGNRARSRRSVDLDVDMDGGEENGTGGGGGSYGFFGTPGGGIMNPAKRRKLPPPTPHVKVLRGARDIEDARGGRRDFGQGAKRKNMLFE